MKENILQLKNVCKIFDTNKVVDDVSIDIRKGEFLTLLGPSGCGKTTTLRMIAGFEAPSSGSIWLEGKPVEEKEPYERNINTVFQNYALFPHMNVFDNIAFGLKMKKVPKNEIKERVLEVLKLVQLEGFADRPSSQLSGGQKQRVAIARAIVNKPKVLLLDEPLGALDLKLRKQMQLELKHLQVKLGITFIYVTHDQEEALTMSDRIIVMNGGRIEQMGSPAEIYEEPKTKFVADFIGESNIYDGNVTRIIDDELCEINSEGVLFTLRNSGNKPGEPVSFSIRPEHIFINSQVKENNVSVIATLKEVFFMGSILKYIFILSNNREIVVTQQPETVEKIPAGGKARLSWKISKASILASQEA
ncbi:MAG: ABC transporter ATP-binding protein [Clostridiaceae bacterium]